MPPASVLHWDGYPHVTEKYCSCGPSICTPCKKSCGHPCCWCQYCSSQSTRWCIVSNGIRDSCVCKSLL